MHEACRMNLVLSLFDLLRLWGAERQDPIAGSVYRRSLVYCRTCKSRALHHCDSDSLPIGWP